MESKSVVGGEERQRLIQEKAYQLYLSRGWGGREVEDWLAAEKAVDAEIAARTREPRREIPPKPTPRVVPPDPPKSQSPKTGGLGEKIRGKFRRASG